MSPDAESQTLQQQPQQEDEGGSIVDQQVFPQTANTVSPREVSPKYVSASPRASPQWERETVTERQREERGNNANRCVYLRETESDQDSDQESLTSGEDSDSEAGTRRHDVSPPASPRTLALHWLNQVYFIPKVTLHWLNQNCLSPRCT